MSWKELALWKKLAIIFSTVYFLFFVFFLAIEPTSLCPGEDCLIFYAILAVVSFPVFYFLHEIGGSFPHTVNLIIWVVLGSIQMAISGAFIGWVIEKAKKLASKK